MSNDRPLIIGLGGASRPGSSTERLLAKAMEIAEAGGARTLTFGGPHLAQLPIFRPEIAERTDQQKRLVEAMLRADGLVIATPSYHAGPSGLVKNALDLLEDLREAPRPYLDGVPVGCIVTSAGWQGGAAALQSLRATVHALRGWPTPLGIVVNTTAPLFGPDGELLDLKTGAQLVQMMAQVLPVRDDHVRQPLRVKDQHRTPALTR